MSKVQLQKIINDLETYRGRGTELVSVYVPPEKSLSDVSTTLTEEYGHAGNIKSKRTRTNVQSALKSLKARLKYYPEIPENGLAMFSGAIEDDGGKTTIYTKVIDSLPDSIQTFGYFCDSQFNVEPLKGQLNQGPVYGLIVLDKRDAHVGTLQGSRLSHHGHVYSLVPGKHKAGGQSAQRFARLRLDAINEFYKKIADLTWAVLGERRHEIAGLLIGGPSPTKEEFVGGDYLHHELQHSIIGAVDVSDTTERGLRELVERGEQHLMNDEMREEKVVMQRFFERLRDGDSVAYGREDVREALSYGAVDVLLVSENELENTVEIRDETEQYGGDVQVISDGFEEGNQLSVAFGGVAALLRYDIK